MKIRNILILIMVILSFVPILSHGQELKGFVDLQTSRYGFKNASGKIIVPAKYNYISDFHNGLAIVSLDKKTGCIDKTGKEVIPLEYNSLLGDFFDDVVIYLLDNKYGILHKSGKRITSPVYEYATHFAEGLVVVKKSKDGNVLFIDKKGDVVLETSYTQAKSFSEGMAAVSATTNSLGIGKWGFIDKQGKEIIPPKYERVERFSDGLAAVSVFDYSTDDWSGSRKWGFIDKEGKVVIPLQFENGMFGPEFRKGKAKVKLKNREFYIDKTGKEVKE